MPLNRSFPLALAAAAILSLSGCATSTANLSTASVAAYRDTVDLNGKIGATYQHNGERGAVSSPFTWTQRPGRVDVTLFTPLGQTAAEISVTPDAATLTQPNREPRVAKDIDTLTQQALGWSLPVAGLRDWLQGYAVDAEGKRFAASPANNHVFTRDGWSLRFTEWQDKPGPNGAPLPKTIRAERSATASSGDLSIVISIFPEG
jgi:outer membrane lipoprotein LolB